MGGLAARRKGSAWALKVKSWLESYGWHVIPTLQIEGAEDMVISTRAWCSIEAKNHQSMTLAAWVDQSERQAAKRGAPVAVVVHHRKGKGSVDDSYVTMSGRSFAEMLRRTL